MGIQGSYAGRVLDANTYLHALEDLTCSLDGQHDRGETRSEEDNVCSRSCGVGSTLDGNTTISFLERGSIVDTWIVVSKESEWTESRISLTITRHRSQMATLL